jgi:hypothetical protein
MSALGGSVRLDRAPIYRSLLATPAVSVRNMPRMRLWCHLLDLPAGLFRWSGPQGPVAVPLRDGISHSW